jgi:large subunit ribosomal protein L5
MGCPLLDTYRNEVLPSMLAEGEYTNKMQVPKLEKIVINTGIGSGRDRDLFDEATDMLSAITGQRPVIRKAKVDVASFKLRKGQNVGVSVTLRGERMYDFFYRLVKVALPRVRDFRGVSPKAFDGRGNYNLGITDQSIFTEVNLDKMKHTIGMNVTIVTSANTNAEGVDLLTRLGFPFAKKES